MSDSATAWIIIVFVVLAMGCGALVSAPFIRTSERDRMKSQIVQHGCGDFVIADTLTGTTEFQWRTQP